MTDLVSMTAQQGIDHPCPRCDAEPGQLCVSVKTGAKRATTHRERKMEDE